MIEGALILEGAQPTLKPKRAMVAWDSRIEALRAVRESLEILKNAEQVRLVQSTLFRATAIKAQNQARMTLPTLPGTA